LERTRTLQADLLPSASRLLIFFLQDDDGAEASLKCEIALLGFLSHFMHFFLDFFSQDCQHLPVSDFEMPADPVEPGKSEETLRDPRSLTAKRIAIVFGIISVVLAATSVVSIAMHKASIDKALTNFTNSLNSLDTSAGTDSLSATPDTSWVPTGYNLWGADQTIAWKWEDSGSYTCNSDAAGGCIKAMFISQNGCPNNFYAAINWLDAAPGSNGNVIGYQNATLPALQALQPAALEFDDSTGDGKSAQMAEITCD